MSTHWSFILISIQREIVQIEGIIAFLLYLDMLYLLLKSQALLLLYWLFTTFNFLVEC